jgi:pimeloyl-ACP methyl ester carboxylesterase
MATFVLVHGAWHGGWCWRHVAPRLRRAGHDVYAPSLTGLGDRAHLARPDLDLDVHVQDVVALLDMEDLGDVLLVAQGYGGMVVTGAADRDPARIRHLVYLDAFVPENGNCALDYVVPERAAAMRGDGEPTGSVAPPPVSLWGLTRPDHVAFVERPEVRHPYRPLTQPIRLRNEALLARLPGTFVYCSSPATGSFDQFAARYKDDPAWRFFELRTGHAAMILVPAELTDVLLESAR